MKEQRGFTLIELLIAMAVLAIIAAVAYPSYRDSVTKTRRGEAKVVLMQAAQGLERCFTRYSSYNNGACDVATGLGGGVASEGGHYSATAAVLTATTYTLVATPQGGQATHDTQCANFSLTHTGTRAVSGTSTADDCW